MMKKILFAIFTAFAFTACDKGVSDETAGIVVPQPEQLAQTVYADDNTGKSAVTFTTTGAWTSEITASAVTKSTDAASDWVSITPSSGDKAGNYTISITLATNYTGEKRSADIVIKSGGELVKVSVSQEALTAEGEKPKPEPSGTGVLRNETTKESVNLVGVTHEISAPNLIKMTFTGEGEKATEFSADFYNPFQDGRLKQGVYNIKLRNTYPVPELNNGECEWYKSLLGDYGTSGTIKVECSDNVYTFTFDIQAGEGDYNYKITGTFTGVPKYLNGEVKVESITLSESQKTLEMGATLLLTATVLPENATDKKYTWSSSNIAVATVSESGLVESVGAGNAIITATTNEGNKTAACTVTVKPAVAVTGIAVEPAEVTLLEGDYHEFYAESHVKVLPENAYNKKYTWTSGNESVAVYSGKGIEAKGAGETIITFTTEDGGKTAILKVIVNKRQTSGNGMIKRVDPSGKYEDLVHSIIKVNHTILSKNCVELSFVSSLGNEAGSFKLYNPLTNGRLSAGTYNCVFPENKNNGTFSDTYNSRTGVMNVDVINDNYTITLDISASSGGFTYTGNYTGVLTYTNEYVDVSSVQLSETAKTLMVGKSFDLTATVLPANAFNKKVIWSSGDPNIASVYAYENGDCSVSALKVGTTTITATTEDGTKTATCVVTVQPIPATGSGTFSNNKGQSVAVNRASQWVNEKEPKEIEIGFYKENSVYDGVQFTLVRGSNDTGALNAGTYTSIQYIRTDDLGVKYSYTNSGSVTVSVNGKTYTISLNITVEDGTKITGTYTGEVSGR